MSGNVFHFYVEFFMEWIIINFPQDNVYWTDRQTESILKSNKFYATANNVTQVVTRLTSPMDVHIYHKLRQPPGTVQTVSWSIIQYILILWTNANVSIVIIFIIYYFSTYFMLQCSNCEKWTGGSVTQQSQPRTWGFGGNNGGNRRTGGLNPPTPRQFGHCYAQSVVINSNPQSTGR